jgi:hypothetical protein
MELAPARPRHETIDHDDLLVHEWRVTRLAWLGSRGRWPRPWPTDLRINGEKALREARHVDFRGRPAVT